MKPVPRKVHAFIDYALVVLLWFAPTIFAFENVGGPAVWIPRAVAVVILLQSLLTKHELGIVKIVPMSVHLMMDYVASIFLAASPFTFGFNSFDSNVWLPHVAVGVGYLIISFLTNPDSLEQHEARMASR